MAKNEVEQSQAVKIALLEQEVENLKSWKDMEDKRSQKVFWVVVMAFVSLLTFIGSKIYEKVLL